jgi:hypothetical protein
MLPFFFLSFFFFFLCPKAPRGNWVSKCSRIHGEEIVSDRPGSIFLQACKYLLYSIFSSSPSPSEMEQLHLFYFLFLLILLIQIACCQAKTATSLLRGGERKGGRREGKREEEEGEEESEEIMILGCTHTCNHCTENCPFQSCSNSTISLLFCAACAKQQQDREEIATSSRPIQDDVRSNAINHSMYQ